MNIMSSLYSIVIQSGYHYVFVGLYNHKNQVAGRTIEKKMVSSILIPSLKELIKEYRLSFDDISYLGVEAGPAPFTTLRVGIATANGLAFAKKIPLIAVSGLQELSRYYKNYTIIYNAFCDDVYVATNGQLSYKSINALIEDAQCSTAHQVTYIGNGVPLHQQRMKEALKEKALFLDEYPLEATLDMVAQAAYVRWCNKTDLCDQVRPLYLKEYSTKQAPIKGA